MALLSVAPLASKSRLHKTLITSAHHLKPFPTTIPTLPVCTRRKTFTASITMCLTAPGSDNGVKRRIGNHHSNLWDHDFILSLSTPYEVIFIFGLMPRCIFLSFQTNEINFVFPLYLVCVLNIVYGSGAFIP